MTRKRHPSARTTRAMRREIQQSEESDRALAARLGINPKTVAKWRGRRTTEDSRKGPKQPVSSVLTPAEEALIVIFRKRMLFTIDDCFLVLKKAIPHLSRSALHRCLKRYGVSRIPAGSTEKLGRAEDSVHYTVELYALPVEMGGKYLLFAISLFNGFVFAKAVEGFLDRETADFLAELIERSPIGVDSVETNDHEAFSDAGVHGTPNIPQGNTLSTKRATKTRSATSWFLRKTPRRKRSPGDGEAPRRKVIGISIAARRQHTIGVWRRPTLARRRIWRCEWRLSAAKERRLACAQT